MRARRRTGSSSRNEGGNPEPTAGAARMVIRSTSLASGADRGIHGAGQVTGQRLLGDADRSRPDRLVHLDGQRARLTWRELQVDLPDRKTRLGALLEQRLAL